MARPLVFLSHSVRDIDVVSELRRWISEALLDGVEFFQSSDDVSIRPGTTWFEDIVQALGRCDIVLVVVTPNMLRSHWAFFEAGAGHLRGVNVVPVCGVGVPIKGLPSPLDQLMAVDVSNADGRRQLISLLASAAELRAPSEIPELNVRSEPPLAALDGVMADPALLGVVKHDVAVQMFCENMRSFHGSLTEILLAGASLTDFVHLRTNALVAAAGGPALERLSIVVKSPDDWWSDVTHRGMCFQPPYDAADSRAMLIQAQRDVLVLREQIAASRAATELVASSWPPTCATGCLVTPTRTFAFFEPMLFGVPLAERPCLVFAEGDPGASPFVTSLRAAHDRMVADGAALVP